MASAHDFTPPADLDDPLLDFWKNLINKFAWALGTTYELEYSNIKAPVRKTALLAATAAVQELGFPPVVAAHMASIRK